MLMIMFIKWILMILINVRAIIFVKLVENMIVQNVNA